MYESVTTTVWNQTLETSKFCSSPVQSGQITKSLHSTFSLGWHSESTVVACWWLLQCWWLETSIYQADARPATSLASQVDTELTLNSGSETLQSRWLPYLAWSHCPSHSGHCALALRLAGVPGCHCTSQARPWPLSQEPLSVLPWPVTSGVDNFCQFIISLAWIRDISLPQSTPGIFYRYLLHIPIKPYLSRTYLLSSQNIFSRKTFTLDILGQEKISLTILRYLKTSSNNYSYTWDIIYNQWDWIHLTHWLYWMSASQAAQLCITGIHCSSVSATDRSPRQGLPAIAVQLLVDVAPLPAWLVGGYGVRVCTTVWELDLPANLLINQGV